MALFSKGENPEVVALQQQLNAAHATIAELRAWVVQLRGAGVGQLEADLRQLKQETDLLRRHQGALQAANQKAAREVAEWESRVVETRELALLQEVGVYEYAHPLDDSLAYKGELAKVRDLIKSWTKDNMAVTCQVDWAVNGSVREGKRLGRDMAKLMLRAYNAEADNAVRAVKPHTREKVKERLTKTRDTISKLGALMHISIAEGYHDVRLHEIDLTADYRMKVEEEKEAARAERERLREEAKVLKEIERERARLAKEQAHYTSVVAKLEQNGDPEALERARAQLSEVNDAMAGVEKRAANVRAGYVYVISNLGAFGPNMVKIGMTRRLEPMDRIRELGDASVPFKFDTHALFFSEDAVALENALHQKFAEKRVNMVNLRREFFYATPAEVREALLSLGNDHILEYNEVAEASEWRASQPHRHGAAAPTVEASAVDGAR